jgi:hypothetical protein
MVDIYRAIKLFKRKIILSFQIARWENFIKLLETPVRETGTVALAAQSVCHALLTQHQY